MQGTKFALLAITTLWAPGTLNASPLVTLSLFGRIHGSGNPFTAYVNPLPGDQLDYELRAGMAPIGTTNIQGATTRTISSLTLLSASTGDGLNSFKIDLFAENGTLTFNGPGTLNPDPSALANDDWNGATGSNGGTPTGSQLDGVRPAHIAGIQTAINSEIVVSGTFVVDQPLLNGPLSLLSLRWASDGIGLLKINGGSSVLLTTTTESSADPIVGFQFLNLYVPEPTSMGLIGLSSLWLIGLRRRNNFFWR